MKTEEAFWYHIFSEMCQRYNNMYNNNMCCLLLLGSGQVPKTIMAPEIAKRAPSSISASLRVKGEAICHSSRSRGTSGFKGFLLGCT